MRAYVGVGSNLGDRWGNLARAARALRAEPRVALFRASRVWDTAPVGPPQPRYLNAVLELETALPARALLAALLRVERGVGRRRGGVRWSARTLDLDLLLYGDARLDERGLTVPHPRLTERRFVLAPLAELSPELVVPGTARTVLEHLAAAPAADLAPLGLFPTR
jgi:2-amino-4-hydroxy-6-hydroxymethyldihydropteridine diphosphokinase